MVPLRVWEQAYGADDLAKLRGKEAPIHGRYDLYARQWMARKKSAYHTQRVECETPPKQPGNSSKKISQRRQVIKNRMKLMCLELTFLYQVHHAGDASERERAIGD